MQDDVKHPAKATRLVESFTFANPGFVPLVTLIELVWVLASCVELTREPLVLDQAEQVTRALGVFSSGTADFADCLISSTASSVGCDKTMTFDVAAAKTAGMTLI
jgi:predicted nucleic-acid-binding protein